MPKTDKNTHRTQGVVLENLPSTNFKVRLDSGKEIIAHLAGKLRIHRIKILPGDNVTVEMSSYDEDRGRIVYRNK
jgi:translation initiation factor IF-1